MCIDSDSIETSVEMKRTQTTLYSRALIAILVIAVFLSYAPTRQHSQSTSEQGLVEKGSSKADVYQAVLDLTNPWTVTSR